MPQSKKEIKINFGIRKISILDYSVETSKVKIETKKEVVFDFNFQIGFLINRKENELVFMLSFTINPQNDKKNILGKMQIEMRFFITNMEDFLHPKEEKINLPDHFLINLIGIVISTSRGIWASKVMGTKLQPAILPIVDSKEFFELLRKQSKSSENR